MIKKHKSHNKGFTDRIVELTTLKAYNLKNLHYATNVIPKHGKHGHNLCYHVLYITVY